MKKRLSSMVTILLGVALMVVSVVLIAKGQSGWFWLMLVAGLVVAAAGIVELRHAEEGDEPKKLPEYRTKSALLSPPERELFNKLNRLLSHQHFLVLPQMALCAVIDKLTQNSYRNELFRVADFCIADAKTTEPLLLIELNDASHKRPDRAERDRKVGEICARAKLPILTLSMREADDEGYVRKMLKKYL